MASFNVLSVELHVGNEKAHDKYNSIWPDSQSYPEHKAGMITMKQYYKVKHWLFCFRGIGIMEAMNS
jgi:hypothetical protein